MAEVSGPAGDNDMTAISLSKMQIWAQCHDTPVKIPLYQRSNANKNQEFEQPIKIRALFIEIRDQRDVQEERTRIRKSKIDLPVVQEPTWVPQIPEQTVLNPGHTVLKFDSPNSGCGNDYNFARLMLKRCRSLDSVTAWDPNRIQRLKRKHACSWTATQASGPPSRCASRGSHCRGRPNNGGDGSGNRPPPLLTPGPRIPPNIPETAEAPGSPYDNVPVNSFLPSFIPEPGDIIISSQCREMDQGRPYFGPGTGGHVKLYVDPNFFQKSRRERYAQGFAESQNTTVPLVPGDIIIRAGRFDSGWNWVPQRFVEVFLRADTFRWCLKARVNYSPLPPPVTYAAGDPTLEYRNVGMLQPEINPMAHGPSPVFRAGPGDLVVRFGGMNDMTIEYYDVRGTRSMPNDMVIRAGYSRLEDCCVGGVEMYHCAIYPQMQQYRWFFQGRDMQFYGGSLVLSSFLGLIDPVLTVRSPPRDIDVDITLADSYILDM